VDINPLFAFPDGVRAVDARVILAVTGPPHQGVRALKTS
jgi:hypothetical protein